MKKFIALALMCIFSLVFTAVRATDTSPGLQKFSIEKTILQVSPAVVTVAIDAPAIPVSVAADSLAISVGAETSDGVLNPISQTHYSPGWPLNKNYAAISANYRIKHFEKSRLIPYSRDRSQC